MIDLALDFLWRQMNTYLRMKLDPASNDDFIQLANISHLNDAEQGNGGNGNNASQNAFLCLVNIEEDRISKSQENFIRKENSVVYKNPRVLLNLYVLFAVNLSGYTEALKRLSLIIQFFQYRNVFDSTNSPSLNTKIEKLIADMYSLNFEQANQLWGTLGGKYLPSVLYKIRLVGIEEEAIDAESGFIKIISINN
jgi:hypothetical protein